MSAGNVGQCEYQYVLTYINYIIINYTLMMVVK